MTDLAGKRCNSWVDADLAENSHVRLRCQDSAGHETDHQWADRSGSPLIVWPLAPAAGDDT